MKKNTTTYRSNRKFIKTPKIGQIVKVYLNDRSIVFGKVMKSNDNFVSVKKVLESSIDRIDFYLPEKRVVFL